MNTTPGRTLILACRARIAGRQAYSFRRKFLREFGAWCIFTAFWGEQQAVAAIVAAACISFEIERKSASVCGPQYAV